MTGLNLSDLATSQLVDGFAETCVAQDQALLYDEIEEFTRLYWQMDALRNELRARGQDAWLTLLSLYGHANMQVRLQAAKCTLAVAPIAARRELESIKNSRHFPQAGDAASALSSLAAGTFKPT